MRCYWSYATKTWLDDLLLRCLKSVSVSTSAISLLPLLCLWLSTSNLLVHSDTPDIITTAQPTSTQQAQHSHFSSHGVMVLWLCSVWQNLYCLEFTDHYSWTFTPPIISATQQTLTAPLLITETALLSVSALNFQAMKPYTSCKHQPAKNINSISLAYSVSPYSVFPKGTILWGVCLHYGYMWLPRKQG